MAVPGSNGPHTVQFVIKHFECKYFLKKLYTQMITIFS